MDDTPCATYIMASETGTLYVGSTTDLESRVREHKLGFYEGSFTKRYRCFKLVYFEYFATLEEARAREYQIKRWRREKKIFLIELENPTWRDLSDDIFE
jgi:putative endonuclease